MTPASADIVPGTRILLLPLGSWEQHGPHLPLDTDSRIVSAVIDATMPTLTDDDFIVAPVIPITASDEHAAFPGTLSAGTEATVATVVAIARSARWARGICIVNGHGGNFDALASIHHALEHERIPHSVWSPPREPGDDLHAGRTETSLMMHIDAQSVRPHLFEAGAEADADSLARMRIGGVVAVSPNGVLGDPAGASADEGRRVLHRYSTSLADHLATLLLKWPCAHR